MWSLGLYCEGSVCFHDVSVVRGEKRHVCFHLWCLVWGIMPWTKYDHERILIYLSW